MTALSSTPCSARTGDLLDWYASHARDLPWRHTQDPYRIWVSEIMLQQTQVTTVLPRYAVWFDTFPDIATLAAAELDSVLKAWEGLGYYRRARFMHSAAQAIVARHGGIFPHDFEDIQALPGIGRSTAGAIASFCFGMGTPVLDGNVKRVLRRWHAERDASDKRLWQLAQEAIEDLGEPDTWNQAMMELGATLCTSAAPRCRTCPVQQHCATAFQVDTAGEKRTGVQVRDVHWQVNLHVDKAQGIWLMRRPDTGIWAGLWTPPIIELAAAPEMPPCHIHQLTHRRLHLYTEASDKAPSGVGQWVADISALALPTGIHQLLAKCGITT